MRQVNIRQLRSGLAGELSDLPFEVTKNGIVIAKVVDPDILAIPGRATAVPQHTKVYGVDGHKSEPAPVYFNPVPKKGK